MSALKKFINSLNVPDLEDFLDVVFVEIEEFLKINSPVGVLVFPPLNSRKRLYIHKIGQEFFNVDTFSIGRHFNRRTVVCLKGLRKQLHEDNVEMEEKDNRKGAVAKTKRTNRPDAPIYVPPASRRKNLEPLSRVTSPKEKHKVVNTNKSSEKTSDIVKSEKESSSEKCERTVPENVIIVPNTHSLESVLNKSNSSENTVENTAIKTSYNDTKTNTIEKTTNENIVSDTSTKESLNQEKSELWIDKNNDQDEKELHRAREEINRKNKKIMKHSFVKSDILIINDQLNTVQLTDKTKPKTESSEAVDSWEDLLDDKTLESTLMVEIIENVGNVKVFKTKNNFEEFKDTPVVYSDFTHVLEVYDFPNVFKTRDLVTIIDSFKCKPFHIKWVDDSHALVVFSSGFAATEVLKYSHPLVKFRPLSQATEQSIFKATRHPDALLPNAIRPQTCPQTARRMVTGALGLRMLNAKEERAQEIKILKEAREKKRLSAKQQDDAWEGRPYPTD